MSGWPTASSTSSTSGTSFGRTARTSTQRSSGTGGAEATRPPHRHLMALETTHPGGSAVSDLLETVIEAHGGLERWNQLNSVSARLIQDGVLWPFKGQEGVLDDVVVTASLH